MMDHYVAKRKISGPLFSCGILIFFLYYVVTIVFVSETDSESQLVLWILIGGLLLLLIGQLKTLFKRAPIAIIERSYLEVFGETEDDSVRFRWEDIERFDYRKERGMGGEIYIVLKNRNEQHFVSEIESINVTLMSNKKKFLEELSQKGIPIETISAIEMMKEALSSMRGYRK